MPVTVSLLGQELGGTVRRSQGPTHVGQRVGSGQRWACACFLKSGLAQGLGMEGAECVCGEIGGQNKIMAEKGRSGGKAS